MNTTVQQYKVMPDKGITMTIDLLDNGIAEVKLEGKTNMPCWCGNLHAYMIEAKMHCDSTMEMHDMNDLDAAITGNEKAAIRFGWRLMNRLFSGETPPCEKRV